MSLFVLILLALSPFGQDGAVGHETEVYAPPTVRPFEPPSSFGRIVSEGDGEADPRRRAITAPVSIEAYSRSYEYAPSSRDTAYDRGVADAEAAMDARMGPLDGLWTLRDADGRPVMQLALSDRGPDRPLEGAFRVGGAGGMGPVDVVARDAGRLRVTMADTWLELTATGDGWTGILTQGGRSQAVTLTR